ncbi:uncharacterized protein LOC125943675 [Dermacentor silvarum]|uniref:uncharacterized protein LOC125943675 n=1 Tax=Dermacentor silvarum TaxID=543639 RepID=UPI002101B2F5|nr:uncharacterized protein LOC125943675 [Dermacentor silvarum]
MQREMAYPHGFHDAGRHSHRDSPILDMPSEFDVGSTIELAPPLARGVAVDGNRSSPAWVSSPARAFTARAVGHYEHGQQRKEAWTASVFEGLRAVGTDSVAAVVSTVVLCFFIGIAIWFLSTVQDQWDGSGLHEADDADAGLHLDLYGAPPSSPVAGVHEKMPTREWKITVRTRRPRSSKPALVSTAVLSDVALTSPAIRWSKDNAIDGGGDDSDESKAPWTSTTDDTTVAIASKRVRSRRRQPSKRDRSMQRSSAKRVKRPHQVPQRAVRR